jgi:hypothetical protein
LCQAGAGEHVPQHEHTQRENDGGWRAFTFFSLP